eukprot:s1_g856.t1
MVPTKVGQFLIEQSRDILAGLEKVERHAMLLGDGTIGRINLGVGPIAGELFLNDAIVEFARQYGGIDLDVRAAESDRLLALVSAGELDLAIGPFDESAVDLGLTVVPVAEDSIMFAVRPEHPLAQETGPIADEQLGRYATVSPHTPMSIAAQIVGHGKGLGITSNQRISCESYATLKHVAKSSDYIVAGPRGLFVSELEDGTLVEIQTDWNVIWRCACIIRPEYHDAEAIKYLVEMSLPTLEAAQSDEWTRRMGAPQETQSSKIDFWGVGTSRTFRPIWTAEELGLDYELHEIGPRTGETQTPEYTAMNPKQKVPYLNDGSLGLSESVAISQYLIEKYGECETFFRPATIEEKAKYEEWCSFILSEIDETSLYVIRRHQDLKEIYGDAPVAVESAAAYLARQFNSLLSLIDGPYLMGEKFSLPDILLVSCIDWALFYELPVPTELQEYRDRIAERPAYQSAMAKNFKFL